MYVGGVLVHAWNGTEQADSLAPSQLAVRLVDGGSWRDGTYGSGLVIRQVSSSLMYANVTVCRVLEVRGVVPLGGRGVNAHMVELTQRLLGRCSAAERMLQVQSLCQLGEKCKYLIHTFFDVSPAAYLQYHPNIHTLPPPSPFPCCGCCPCRPVRRTAVMAWTTTATASPMSRTPHASMAVPSPRPPRLPPSLTPQTGQGGLMAHHPTPPPSRTRPASRTRPQCPVPGLQGPQGLRSRPVGWRRPLASSPCRSRQACLVHHNSHHPLVYHRRPCCLLPPYPHPLLPHCHRCLLFWHHLPRQLHYLRCIHP